MLFLEVEKGEGGGKLEERGMERLEECTLLLNEVDDALLAYRLSVDADALAEIDQMGEV